MFPFTRLRHFLYGSIKPAIARFRLFRYARKIPSSRYSAQSTAEEVTDTLDLSGLTAIVTGCNSGIGYETMRILARRGAYVLGTARTYEKAEAACASIEGRTTPLTLELTDFDSINACTEQINALGIELDILVCNAGVLLSESAQVHDLEMHFVTNHLGHFTLVNNLMPLLRAARAARVVVVGSSAYGKAPEGGIQFHNLNSDQNWQGGNAYFHSKLANGLFSAELARRLRGTKVTSNCVNPGIVDTNIFRHSSSSSFKDMKSVEQGAATTCYVATHPSLESVSGYFFVDCNPAIPMDHMQDAEMAAQLWQVSEELVPHGRLGQG